MSTIIERVHCIVIRVTTNLCLHVLGFGEGDGGMREDREESVAYRREEQEIVSGCGVRGG